MNQIHAIAIVQRIKCILLFIFLTDKGSLLIRLIYLSNFVSLFFFQDGQSRTIRQFHFTDWPEQGVPKSGEGFIDFIGQVHKTKEQFGQEGPITVHCR